MDKKLHCIYNNGLDYLSMSICQLIYVGKGGLGKVKLFRWH